MQKVTWHKCLASFVHSESETLLKLLEKSISLSFDMGINMYGILRDEFWVERMRIIIQKL